MKTIISSLIILALSFSSYSQTTIKESEKIATFCKVWGFLKYYHPLVAKGKLDWDKEFTTRVKSLSKLNSKQEISNYYSNWINSLGKVKHCTKCTAEIPDSLKFNLDLKWLGDSTKFTTSLIKQLEYIQQNRNQKENYYVQQVKDVGNTSYENEKPYTDSVFPSPELRLLGLSRYWNIVNYFYPYKYKIGQDWNNVLIEMIPTFKDAKDTIAYHLAMLELTVKINDSHAFFSTSYTRQYFGTKEVSFNYEIIDNKAIVTGLHNDSLCKIDDIQLGDVFLNVDNKSIADIFQERRKYIPASNEGGKLLNFSFVNFPYNCFSGSTDSVITTFERNGTVKQKYVHRYPILYNFARGYYNNNVVDTCKILKGNIGYMNLGLLRPEQVDRLMEKLKNTKAIIFDVRNHPHDTYTKISEFLNADKQPFAKFTNSDISYPGIYHFTSSYSCGNKNSNYYKGQVVLLCNETSQSHSEFTLMALQTAPNVTTVGSQTSGADGNISAIIFPGNYKTYMTGIGVYYPNGRETQRIGIVPDIEVKPTIEGIRLHKDEVLEKAMEVINEK